MLFFKEKEKRSSCGITFRSKGENQKQTQPTQDNDAMIRTQATLVGGEYSDALTNVPPLPPIMVAILRVLYFVCLFVCFFRVFVIVFCPLWIIDCM